MTLWLVRAGRNGEQEDIALEEGLAVIGWDNIPNLSEIASKDDLRDMYIKQQPDESLNRIGAWVGQIWAFGNDIEEGDIVALPLKSRGTVAFGKVVGPYRYCPDNPQGAKHTRSVEWLKPDVSRTSLAPDLLRSLGAMRTVCTISRNDSEERVREILAGQPPPSSDVEELSLEDLTEEAPISDEEVPLDIEQYARDEIRNFIGKKYREHELAELVTILLEIEGYKTEMSSPGPDGGVDITAGRGPLGFDSPRICVQVKSSNSAANVNVIRQLQGVVDQFGADHGLFVSWGGFNREVRRQARTLFFRIRLWTGEDLVDRILQNYDLLPDDVQSELPLKRIWTLVPEE